MAKMPSGRRKSEDSCQDFDSSRAKYSVLAGFRAFLYSPTFWETFNQPVLDTDIGIYQVNHVLKHDCSHKYNCKFSLLCKNAGINEYPAEFKLQESEDVYYDAKKLDFLSPESVLYVNPGERFSEDVVVKLNQGVYRVLLIGIFGKKRNGCSCANKQFIIGLNE